MKEGRRERRKRGGKRRRGLKWRERERKGEEIGEESLRDRSEVRRAVRMGNEGKGREWRRIEKGRRREKNRE